jgi:hypothetical protein
VHITALNAVKKADGSIEAPPQRRRMDSSRNSALGAIAGPASPLIIIWALRE